MPAHYRLPTIGLHWLTLLLIITAYVLASLLEDMTLSPQKLQLYAWHKWVGLTVLFLLPLRLLFRFLDPLDHRAELTAKEIKVSAAVHGLLYLLLIAVPLFGWLHSSAAGFSVVWFGVLPMPDMVGKDKALAEIFKELHEGSVNLLIALVVVHAVAAVYHHHIRRDGVLVRMVPWLKKKA
jgi:cytochrome b561